MKKNFRKGNNQWVFIEMVTQQYGKRDNASAAARLKEKDRIKLGNIDVTTKYDKEKGREYVNYTCFGFEPASISAAQSTQPSEGDNPVGEGVLSDGDVPF